MDNNIRKQNIDDLPWRTAVTPYEIECVKKCKKHAIKTILIILIVILLISVSFACLFAHWGATFEMMFFDRNGGGIVIFAFPLGALTILLYTLFATPKVCVVKVLREQVITSPEDITKKHYRLDVYTDKIDRYTITGIKDAKEVFDQVEMDQKVLFISMVGNFIFPLKQDETQLLNDELDEILKQK